MVINHLDAVSKCHSGQTTVLLLVTAWLCWLATLPAVCAADEARPVEHVVIVWLKDSGNVEQRAKILDESIVLQSIPGVVSIKSGQVIASERSIVDSSFDVALIVSFSDRAALDAYLVHPVHVQLVEETLKPLVARIQVYDLM
jgi:hypothetical protein